MKNTVPRLPLKQEIIDTLLICTTFFVTALIGDAWLFIIIIGFSFVMAIVELLVSSFFAEEDKQHCEVIWCTAMMLTLAVALVLLFMRKLQGVQYLLWIGVVTASDASGLLFGRLFGERQAFFSKRVSPNKTYAGYIGEIVGSIAAGWLIVLVMKMHITSAELYYIHFGVFACALGDLLGSAAKRELGIKDSEQFLRDVPVLGQIEKLMRSRHGFLDCFDSASMALIFYIILLAGCP